MYVTCMQSITACYHPIVLLLHGKLHVYNGVLNGAFTNDAEAETARCVTGSHNKVHRNKIYFIVIYMLFFFYFAVALLKGIIWVMFPNI